MIFELKETARAAALFEGMNDTLITSCLQEVMGKIYVTDVDAPRSALACVGCFAFCAGRPDRELLIDRPAGFMILIPQNEAWAALIEACFPDAKKTTRYAIRKDTRFDPDLLRRQAEKLPEGYELRPVDGTIYDLCLQSPLTEDFVSVFGSKENFLRLGRGMVILRNGRIVSGASSYSRYREGIEIEVDTVPEERRKGLAGIACAALILSCMEEGLYPSWDAQNQISVHLAEKLGYEFDHEYTVYEICDGERTH